MRLLGMVGTTFRRCGQEEMRRYVLADADAPDRAVRALHDGCDFAESVYLATCNRVEIIFKVRPGATVADSRRRLFAHFHPGVPANSAEVAAALHAYEGEGAAEHLFTVAASLDSMNPGEAQILGQVKAAYGEARARGLCGPTLGMVFDEAFAAAKRVRHATRLGTGTVSMVSLATGVMDARLMAGSGRLAIIGVGEMARQCAQVFQRRGNTRLLFVNRTLARAEALAGDYQGQAMALSAFLADPPPVDVILTATAAESPFLGDDFFPRVRPLPLIVDLSVQRDVDPRAAARAGASVYDLDRLNDLASQARTGRASELAAARVLVDDALDGFRRRLCEREMAPVVRALRDRTAAMVSAEVAALIDRFLPNADASARAEIGRWAASLTGKLAHGPTVGLKQVAFEHGMEPVETFLAGMGQRGSGGPES